MWKSREPRWFLLLRALAEIADGIFGLLLFVFKRQTIFTTRLCQWRMGIVFEKEKARREIQA